MILSGVIVARQAVRFDYCFRETIASLLPVVDELLIGTADSDDGTNEALQAISDRNGRVRLVPNQFLDPAAFADKFWYDNWVNFTRRQASGKMTLVLDCDEVLGPESYEEVRRAAGRGETQYFNYVNFWRSAQETTPWGDGRQIRLLPRGLYYRSHGPVPAGETDARDYANTGGVIRSIYHYTMLRHPAALYDKCRFLGRALEGWEPDELLCRAEREGKPPTTYFTDKQVFPFTGEHPPVIHQWLLDRGHKL